MDGAGHLPAAGARDARGRGPDRLPERGELDPGQPLHRQHCAGWRHGYHGGARHALAGRPPERGGVAAGPARQELRLHAPGVVRAVPWHRGDLPRPQALHPLVGHPAQPAAGLAAAAGLHAGGHHGGAVQQQALRVAQGLPLTGECERGGRAPGGQGEGRPNEALAITGPA